MSQQLREEELQKLDKQTLITLLITMNASLASLEETIKQLNENNQLLVEEIKKLRMSQFGRSSEKNLTEMELAFNEGEVSVDNYPDTKEPKLEEAVKKPVKKRGKKKIGKREEEIEGIPIRIIEHELSQEELVQIFPDGKWSSLPDEVYKRLEFHPASFEVFEHHVHVYTGKGEKTIVRANRPVELLRNSLATASLVAGLYNYKYVNSQPIYRLSQEFERNGINLPTQTLGRWAIVCADRYLKKLYDRLKEKLFDYHVIHADETPVKINKDGRKAGSKSYMWVYRSGALEEHPFVLYEYQKTRKSDHPREFLKGFKGYCVTDGYQVYHTIADEREDLTIAGCWAHARRGFANVIKASDSNDDTIKESIAYKALQLIQTMSRYEQVLTTLTPEERLNERKRSVAPVVDAFFAYIKQQQGTILPKSATGQAIQYCINQESFLRVFLTDGYVPMTNNAAERGIRTFCLGKKNWYLIDTISGAKSSAIAYSIAETAKENHLKPYEYFKYLLEEIPKHGEFEDDSYLEEFLPWSKSLPKECYKSEK